MSKRGREETNDDGYQRSSAKRSMPADLEMSHLTRALEGCNIELMKARDMKDRWMTQMRDMDLENHRLQRQLMILKRGIVATKNMILHLKHQLVENPGDYIMHTQTLNQIIANYNHMQREF